MSGPKLICTLLHSLAPEYGLHPIYYKEVYQALGVPRTARLTGIVRTIIFIDAIEVTMHRRLEYLYQRPCTYSKVP